jgi:hypothetical protein
MIVGRVNPNQTLEDNGIFNTAKVFYNLRDHDLITEAIKRDEGVAWEWWIFFSFHWKVHWPITKRQICSK